MTTKSRAGVFGFTLIEMVIAIGIFAVISTISFTTLSRFLTAREQIVEHDTRLREIQTVFALLERDIRFTINRAIRDPDDGNPHPAIQSQVDDPPASGEILRLTISTPALESSWQDVSRVAWRIDGDELFRVTWEVLDPVHDSEESNRLVFTGVNNLAVRFFKRSNQATPSSSFIWDDLSRLPDAVELLLTTDDDREYRRLLELS